MKLLESSKEFMKFFLKNNYISNTKQTRETKQIITHLYHDFLEAYKYLVNIKQNTNYTNLKIKKITDAKHLRFPKSYSSHSFPDAVRDHIKKYGSSELTFTFSLYGRKITIYFVLEKEDENKGSQIFHLYVESVILWLHILNKYASKACSSTLILYFFFTSLSKKLPNSNIDTLNTIHINTAFTTTCPRDSEIVVYRKEEWFKVFIHESFHNFALDFSDMNNTEIHKLILQIFPVKSEVNLYETYTEFWAEIINALFCSFHSLKDKNNLKEFLSNSDFFIQFERNYSFFQMVKILRFMGLTYKDLYSPSKKSQLMRANLYKENTNVLSYYVIKLVLLNNYQGFLLWCSQFNTSLLQFKKTLEAQKQFVGFIYKNYNKRNMLENVLNTEYFLDELDRKKKTNAEKNGYNYLLNNLRMTICELG